MTALGDTRQLAYIAGQASDARVNVELETEGMTLNIGPQHPATHGTLRVIVKLDGERVVAAEPVMGYMHRGYEKLSEVRTYPPSPRSSSPSATASSSSTRSRPSPVAGSTPTSTASAA